MKLIKLTIIILAVLLLQNTNGFAQGIAINDDGTDANSSALLDVKSNAGTQGFLLPRMTEAQKNAITTPATSLLIYQTDGTQGFYYYNGSQWAPVSNGITSYATIAAIEALSGSDNQICYVEEIETFYRYEDNAANYIDDNKYILSTDDGGNTRWLGITGKYNLLDNSLDKIVHLDATSGSATITDLNKIYYIGAASTTTTITIPDANASNEGWFLRLYKHTGTGYINIQTVSGQDIDGNSIATIIYTGKGLFIKADTESSPEWLKLQDSRQYVPITLNSSADYGATENWAFDYFLGNTDANNITITAPSDMGVFPEGARRMFFNIGSNLMYLDPNENALDGTTEHRIIAPGGYMEFQKINGLIKNIREKNISLRKSPGDISNLECWLDASQLSGSDGSSVSSWTDLENGTVFSASAGEEPTLQTNEQNNKNVVRFDGTNDVMSAGDVEMHNNTRGFSIISVVKASDTKRMAILSKYYTTGDNRQYAFGNKDNMLFEAGDWASSTGAVMALPSDNFAVVEYIWKPGNAIELYINGVLQATGNLAVNDISDLSGNLKLGCGDYTYVGFWDGDFAEIMIYSEAVSDSERKILRDNLAVKWDVDEIIIANGGEKYFQRDGNTNTLSPDVADDNIDLSGGTMTANDFAFTNGGTATPSVRQVVNAGVAVTMDNISVQLTSSGNRNLQLKTLTGSFDGNCSASGVFSGSVVGGITQNITYSTTYTSLINSGWNYALGGDYCVYMVNDMSNNLWYKITLQIGDGWTDNLIMIERLF